MRRALFLKQAIAGAVFVLANAQALAADPAPRILREPVLGLHYERAQVKFDRLPPQPLANCETLADNEYRTGEWYVYGKTRDASGRTFYVTGGYEEWLDGRPAHRKFDTEDLGLVVYADSQSCEPGDPARDTFDQRGFDDILTPSILKQLAVDVVRRLERAFGGPDRLRLELRNQRVDLDTLPPELRDAMKAGVPPGEPRVQQLARRWADLFRAYAGDDPATHARIREAYANEPDLRSGSAVDAALLAYLRQAAQ